MDAVEAALARPVCAREGCVDPPLPGRDYCLADLLDVHTDRAVLAVMDRYLADRPAS
jgi:hypothetical protein